MTDEDKFALLNRNLNSLNMRCLKATAKLNKAESVYNDTIRSNRYHYTIIVIAMIIFLFI